MKNIFNVIKIVNNSGLSDEGAFHVATGVVKYLQDDAIKSEYLCNYSTGHIDGVVTRVTFMQEPAPEYKYTVHYVADFEEPDVDDVRHNELRVYIYPLNT